MMITALWIGDRDLLSEVQSGQPETGGRKTITFKRAGKLATGMKPISHGDIDVVLLDLFLPDSEGLETFLKVHKSTPQIPKIIIADQSEMQTALKAVEMGAEDYLVKEEISGPLVTRTIRHTIEQKQMEAQVKRLQDELGERMQESAGETEKYSSDQGGLLAEHKRTMQDLVKSEKRYREIVEEITYLIYYTTDIDGYATYVNQPCADLTGFTVEELTGMHYLGLIRPDWRGKAELLYRDQFMNRVQETVMDFPINTKSGELKWIEQTVRLLTSDGYVHGYQGIGRDITDQKKAENKLLAALSEKEVLLKEVHHRMKNNLLAISGLLHFQSGSIKDEDARKALANCQRRIMSMAVIHEKLYQMEDLANINVGDYIRTLADHIVRSFSVSPEKIAVFVPIDGIRLNMETAVPCGLIITELITNALEYAFPDSGMGTIRIELEERSVREFTLTVSDDGVGIAPDLDIDKASSLGLLLTRALLESLGGTMEIDRKAGTTFRIRFTEYREGNIEPIADLSPHH